MYLAEFVAKIYQKDPPNVGKHTFLTEESVNFYSCNFTLIDSKNLSFEGLVEPSKQWEEVVKSTDKYFPKFHRKIL